MASPAAVHLYDVFPISLLIGAISGEVKWASKAVGTIWGVDLMQNTKPTFNLSQESAHPLLLRLALDERRSFLATLLNPELAGRLLEGLQGQFASGAATPHAWGLILLPSSAAKPRHHPCYPLETSSSSPPLHGAVPAAATPPGPQTPSPPPQTLTPPAHPPQSDSPASEEGQAPSPFDTTFAAVHYDTSRIGTDPVSAPHGQESGPPLHELQPSRGQPLSRAVNAPMLSAANLNHGRADSASVVSPLAPTAVRQPSGDGTREGLYYISNIAQLHTQVYVLGGAPTARSGRLDAVEPASLMLRSHTSTGGGGGPDVHDPNLRCYAGHALQDSAQSLHCLGRVEPHFGRRQARGPTAANHQRRLGPPHAMFDICTGLAADTTHRNRTLPDSVAAHLNAAAADSTANDTAASLASAEPDSSISREHVDSSSSSSNSDADATAVARPFRALCLSQGTSVPFSRVERIDEEDEPSPPRRLWPLSWEPQTQILVRPVPQQLQQPHPLPPQGYHQAVPPTRVQADRTPSIVAPSPEAAAELEALAVVEAASRIGTERAMGLLDPEVSSPFTYASVAASQPQLLPKPATLQQDQHQQHRRQSQAGGSSSGSGGGGSRDGRNRAIHVPVRRRNTRGRLKSLLRSCTQKATCNAGEDALSRSSESSVGDSATGSSVRSGVGGARGGEGGGSKEGSSKELEEVQKRRGVELEEVEDGVEKARECDVLGGKVDADMVTDAAHCAKGRWHQVRLQLHMPAPVTASTARVGDSLPLASSSTAPTLPASPPGHEPLLLLQLTDVDELVRIAEDLEEELLASYRRYDQLETLLAHEHELLEAVFPRQAIEHMTRLIAARSSTASNKSSATSRRLPNPTPQRPAPTAIAAFHSACFPVLAESQRYSTTAAGNKAGPTNRSSKPSVPLQQSPVTQSSVEPEGLRSGLARAISSAVVEDGSGLITLPHGDAARFETSKSNVVFRNSVRLRRLRGVNLLMRRPSTGSAASAATATAAADGTALGVAAATPVAVGAGPAQSSVFPHWALAGGGLSGVRPLPPLASAHRCVTVLFADIVGFTSMCNELQPLEVMNFLNRVYTGFDSLCDIYGVYKVETIGDCFMVVGGLIAVDDNGAKAIRADGSEDSLHALKVMSFAKALLREAVGVTLPHNAAPLQLRVGLHSGPVTAGIVGAKMPRFCLFGDTVNTANRMENTCQPGTVHVSTATKELLPAEAWEATGGVQVKGKGEMQTYIWRPPGGCGVTSRAGFSASISGVESDADRGGDRGTGSTGTSISWSPSGVGNAVPSRVIVSDGDAVCQQGALRARTELERKPRATATTAVVLAAQAAGPAAAATGPAAATLTVRGT